MLLYLFQLRDTFVPDLPFAHRAGALPEERATL